MSVKLLKDSKLPGMKILQFAFHADGNSDYMPHNIEENSICYIGTHDNETVNGWLETVPEKDLVFAREYMHMSEDEDWCDALIRTGMSTPSKLFVVTMQDLLKLPKYARMNTPGNPQGNWTWRMRSGVLTPELAEKLRHLTALYRRLPEKAEAISEKE